jgi:hypothetical protein
MHYGRHYESHIFMFELQGWSKGAYTQTVSREGAISISIFIHIIMAM